MLPRPAHVAVAYHRRGVSLGLRFLPLLVALTVALSALLLAPTSRSQEPARPATDEFETLVRQMSIQIDAIREASRSFYQDFQTWPADVIDLIGDGYLSDTFPPLTPWGETFKFQLAGDQLDIDVVMPTNAELTDLAERTDNLDPTTQAEKTIIEDEPVFAEDYFSLSPTAVKIRTEITQQEPYNKKANVDYERVAKSLTITSDQEYLDSVKKEVYAGRPPVGYVTLDAGEGDEAHIATDRERFVFNRGARFVGDLITDVVRDSDSPTEWFIDLSGSSRLNRLAVSVVEDSANPQYRLELAGRSRLNQLQASQLETPSATIESADIVVLNGSAPVNRGQLDTFAVTQLNAGENIIVDNPVGNVTVSIVPNPTFENVATRGLATINTLQVDGGATIQGVLTVEGDINARQDLFVGGAVVIGDDSEVEEPYSLYVGGDLGVEEGIFTDGAFRAGGLVLDTNAIAHENDPIVLRPNANTAATGGLELSSDGVSLSFRALGDTNLRLQTEGDRMEFQNAQDSAVGFSFRGGGENVMVIDTLEGRVGIGVENPQVALHVGGTIIADAFVGDGSGLYGVQAGSLAGEGDVVIEAGTGGGGDGDIIFRVEGQASLRISPEGNVGIGEFVGESGPIDRALSVGDGTGVRFSVDGTSGDVLSEGDLVVRGNVFLGDGPDDRLAVAGQSEFLQSVTANNGLEVVGEDFSGDLVSVSGRRLASSTGTVFSVAADRGLAAQQPVVVIERQGEGPVVDFYMGANRAFGIYALSSTDSATSFRDAPGGSIAVGLAGALPGVAGRLFVLSVPPRGGQPAWQRLSVSADLDGQSVLLEGGNAATSALRVGSTTAESLLFITDDIPALEIDGDQAITVLEDNELRFRDEKTRILSPAPGELLLSADGKLTLESATVEVRASQFNIIADAVSIDGAMEISGTLTANAEVNLLGDVVLGRNASDTITINGGLTALTLATSGGSLTMTGGDSNGEVTVTLPSTPGTLVVMEDVTNLVRLDGDLVVDGVTVAGDSTFSGAVRVTDQLVVGGADFRSRRSPLNVQLSAPEGAMMSFGVDSGGSEVTWYSFSGNNRPVFGGDRGSLAMSSDGLLWLRSQDRTWRQVLADELVFQHGGNQFGEAAVLGTNDAHPLNLIANGAPVVSISSTQVRFLQPLVTEADFTIASVATVDTLQVDGVARLNGSVFLGDDGGDAISLGGVIVNRDDGKALAFQAGAGRVLSLSIEPLSGGDVDVRLPAADGELLTNGQTAVISEAMLQNGAVTVGKIAPGAVDGTALADNSVTSAKILDGTITGDDIADGTITAAKLANTVSLVIGVGDIADGAITGDEISDGSIEGRHVAEGTLTGAKFANDLVLDGRHVADGVIVESHIANDAVTEPKIADDAVTGAKILDGTITSADLAPGTVSGLNLASGAVGAEQLADGAVGAEHISPAAMERVAQSVLSPGAVGAEQLADGAVGSGQLADGAVGAEQLADGAVGNDKLVAGTNYDRITRVGQLEELEVAGPIRARLDLASAAGATLCLSGAAISQCSSLAALKSAVRPLDLGLDTVLALRPRRFLWNADGREDFGFVAEEVTAVDPLLGSYAADGSLVGVRYRQMSALLARAVQEQQAELGPLSAALSANSAGHVGVGKAPHTDYRLDVAGSVRAGVYVETSDRRLKRDLRPLSGAAALAALSGIDGMRYRWNEAYRRMRPGAESGWQVGVIAQQVAGRLPDLVRQGSDGYLAVSYDRFVPYLIEAVNELSARAEGMRAALAPAPGGLRLRRPLLGADGRAVVSPAGDIHARSLSVAGDMAVGDRFSLRRSSTLASLLRLDVERRGDDTVEGYLSARDVYLADRGKWGSELDARVESSREAPIASECADPEHSGAMKLVADKGELYVCSGEGGWLSAPLASSDRHR